MLRGAKKEGTPCRRCGGTLRYVRNRECVSCSRSNRKSWRESNSELARERGQRYRKKSIVKIKAYVKTYQRDRARKDPQYRLTVRLRTRLWFALKGRVKTGSAVNDLGCTVAELKMRIEGLWKPGMSWDNYGHGAGRWNIDHVKPLSAFNLVNRQEFLEANHYSNLQPLWHAENMLKGGAK